MRGEGPRLGLQHERRLFPGVRQLGPAPSSAPFSLCSAESLYSFISDLSSKVLEGCQEGFLEGAAPCLGGRQA